MEKYKNVILNILNVIDRISHEDFIREYWGEGKKYNSIVISCSEALEILDDYFFYDLDSQDKGAWKEIVTFLSNDAVELLCLLAKKISKFKGYDKKVDQLLADVMWIEIMDLSKNAKEILRHELGVKKSEYLI